MSWYIVRKCINGRYYLYRQRTYRVGKSVKTENEYLGPAGAAITTGPSVSVTAPHTPEEVRRFDTSTGVTPQMKRFLDEQRRADERIQYGNLAERVARQKSAVRAAKKATKGIKSVNPFLAQTIKKP